MLISTASFAAIFVTGIGLLLLWSNPGRAVNRAVFSCSLNWSAWLASLHVASHLHGGLVWVRIACAVATFLPLQLWLVNETIAGGWAQRSRADNRRLAAWIVGTVLMAAMCFTDFFIDSTPGAAHGRGVGYYTYIALYSGVIGFVLYRAFKTLEGLTGGRRIELQVWLIGGCAMVLSILTAMALNATTRSHVYIQVQPLFVLTFYAGTAYAITIHRIFDAQQILRVLLNKLILVSVVAGIAYGVFFFSLQFFSEGQALLPTVAAALLSASVLKLWLDRWFEFYPQDMAARQAAYTVAHNETRADLLEAAFLDVLRGWGRAEHALITTGAGGRTTEQDEDLTDDERVANAMRQFRWVTPERLARERPTAEHEVMNRFMAERRLGVVVFSETPMLYVVVGVGIPASRRAFTYPQITHLQELASIIESALERTLMVLKIQHTEQLATVGLLGASLAHEIRNPLVSVKAIVQLLPSRYQEAAFREKFFRLISDEVVRIDRLTEQLLDLASPRVYTARPVDLHPLLKSSLDLVGPRAADKNVTITSAFAASPDQVFTDPAAVTQVLLNLCFNGIQALDGRASARAIVVATRNTEGGVELSVTDNGPGITPEMRVRMFKPFQTTKSTGFGLGLTVCRDILAGLKAQISVDRPTPGQGATFRVTFPCPP